MFFFDYPVAQRLKRKKGLGLPLSGTCPAVSADKLPCFQFSYRDVLISLLGGRGFGFPISPKLAEAFLWRRMSEWFASATCVTINASCYATIFQRLMSQHRTGQRLRTDRTSYSVALEDSETVVRNGKL